MANIVTVKPKELGAGALRMGLAKHHRTRGEDTKDHLRVPGNRVMGFKLPMNDLIPNPFFEEGNGQPEKITNKEYFMKRTGGGTDFGLNSEFWENYKIALEDRINFFDIDNAWKELDVFVLKNLSEVATSPNEMHKKPNARYVIYEASQEVEKNAKIAEVKTEAVILLASLTPEYKKDLCRVFDKQIANFTDGAINSVLFDFINNAPKGAERFLEVTKAPKERVKVESLIKEALNVDALRNAGGSIVRVVDNQEGGIVGADLNKAIDFLSLKKNSIIREAIENEIKVKRSTKIGIN